MEGNPCTDELGRKDVTPCVWVSPSWCFDVL